MASVTELGEVLAKKALLRFDLYAGHWVYMLLWECEGSLYTTIGNCVAPVLRSVKDWVGEEELFHPFQLALAPVPSLREARQCAHDLRDALRAWQVGGEARWFRFELAHRAMVNERIQHVFRYFTSLHPHWPVKWRKLPFAAVAAWCAARAKQRNAIAIR